MRVELSLIGYGFGKYMYGKGTGFADHIDNYIKDLSEEDSSQYKNLMDCLNKEGKHNEDIIYDILRDEISLPFEFAKNINLYDVISAKCFRSASKVGRELIEILCEMEIFSIVTMKQYEDLDRLFFDLVVCHEDYVRDLKQELTDGKNVG